jgi:hypothetical protein
MQAGIALSAAITLYMTFWLSQAEAALAQVAWTLCRHETAVPD